MRNKKISVNEPISTFLGIEKITDISSLLDAMHSTVISRSLKEPYVTFPESCILEINERGYNNKATISISAKNRINPEKMLAALLVMLQKDQMSRTSGSVFVNFRYNQYAAQIFNGHLKLGSDNQAMPMFPIQDPADRTFIKVMKTYIYEQAKTYEGKTRPETIYDLMDNTNLRNNDVVEGPMHQLISILKREKPEEDIAKSLGFNVIAHDSTGKFNGGANDKCSAVRLCIHAEEIPEKDLVTKATELYKRMKTLRKDPGFIIGIVDNIEIHIDSKRITISSHHKTDYMNYLAKILELSGVRNLDTASIKYIKENHEEDAFIVKMKDAFLETMSDTIETFIDFFKSKTVQAYIYCLILMTGAYLSFVFMLNDGIKIYECILIALPSFAYLTSLIGKSKEDSWIKKVGTFHNIWYPGIMMTWSMLVFVHLGMLSYLKILTICVICYLAFPYITKYGSKYAKSDSWKRFKDKLYLLEKEIYSNRLFNVLCLVFAVITGIVSIITFGILTLALVVPICVIFLLAAIADRRFRDEYAYETERYKDRFFSTFREERPGLSSSCRIKLKLSKCPKLLIWIPLKVFTKKIISYGKEKYPHSLTITGLKGRAKKLADKVSASDKPVKT